MHNIDSRARWPVLGALGLAVAVGLAPCAATAQAEPPSPARAYTIGDFPRAKAWADDTGGDQAFFAGAAKASDLDWPAARELLQRAVDDPSTTPEVRLRAMRALLSVLLAHGDYAAADRHVKAHFNELEPDVRDGAGLFASVLARQPAPRAVIRSASQPVHRDLAGLYRSQLQVGSKTVDAILDTGANFSVVRASVAQEAGLKLLEPAIKVGDSAGQVAEGHLALGRVAFAGSVFENAVFIVLPDKSLDFPGGYRIDAILGFPQLSRYGALAFTADKLELTAPNGPRSLGERNLRFKDFKLYVDATVEGVPLTLFLDTGARRSGLSNLAGPRLPKDRLGGTVKQQTLTGTGGDSTVQVVEVPDAKVVIAGRETVLKKLPVRIGGTPDDRLGVIGQDVLSATGGYTLDFQRMRLETRR